MSSLQRIKVDNTPTRLTHNMRKPNSSSYKGPGGPNQNEPYTRALKFMPESYGRLNAHSHGRSRVFNQNVSTSEYMPRRDGRQNTRSYEWYNRSQHVFITSSLCLLVNQVYFKKVIF